MRCYICDRVIDKPNFNKDHGDYDPCETCLEVINDLFQSHKDRPYAAEDELGIEDLSSYDFIYLDYGNGDGNDLP